MRRPDWRGRLDLYVNEVRRLPFSPGTHDCALFVAGAIEAMTGEDPAAELRGRYRTLEEGLVLLQSQGFIDHVDAAAARFERIPREMAQIGDLAVVKAEAEGRALGLVGGHRVFVVGHRGMLTVDLLDLAVERQAFRVN